MVITAEERTVLQRELLKLSGKARKIVNKLLFEYDKQNFRENLSIEDLAGEIWRWVKGYENLYQVSNKARVKSFHKGKIKILKQGFAKNGYPTVNLYKEDKDNKESKGTTYLVHRLVAEAFIPNPENKPIVDHIDGDRSNACVENLRWLTQKENIQAAIQKGTHKIGTESPLAKLTEEDVKYIRENYEAYDRVYGIRALARKFNVSISTVADIIHYRNYKDVD